jgi:hypothetical protein
MLQNLRTLTTRSRLGSTLILGLSDPRTALLPYANEYHEPFVAPHKETYKTLATLFRI